MPSVAWRSVLALVIVSDAASGEWGSEAADEPIPDKVGAEVHVSKHERSVLRKIDCSMCKAIVREMHTEVVKHSMTQKGWGSESQVWETSNAMCLAMLQKYKLDLRNSKLERKTEGEDDEETMMSMGGDAENLMRGMLVLKMGCQQWVEDHGGDTSGYIYKAVRGGEQSAEDSAKDFCLEKANLCGSKKKEKQKQEKEHEKQRRNKRQELSAKEDLAENQKKKEDPFENLPEDSKFGLQRLLEMAKDDPLHYMEDDAKQRIVRGRAEIQCDVCRAVIEDVHRQVSKRPKSMQREHDILPFADGACEGGKDLSVPNYFGIEPPPLPPAWTDRYRPRVDKKTQEFRLKPFPKKAAKKRQQWRNLTPTGKQQPPSSEENEGDVMMTMACREMLEPARISEVLYEQMSVCNSKDAPASCNPVSASAWAFCSGVGDSPCDFGTALVKAEL